MEGKRVKEGRTSTEWRRVPRRGRIQDLGWTKVKEKLKDDIGEKEEVVMVGGTVFQRRVVVNIMYE